MALMTCVTGIYDIKCFEKLEEFWVNFYQTRLIRVTCNFYQIRCLGAELVGRGIVGLERFDIASNSRKISSTY